MEYYKILKLTNYTQHGWISQIQRWAKEADPEECIRSDSVYTECKSSRNQPADRSQNNVWRGEVGRGQERTFWG